MQTMSKQETKAKGTPLPSLRPIGLTISSFYYAASGIYYLLYPLLVQDTGIWPLYVIGFLSLLGSFGLLRMTRWGLWLGLGLFLPQIIAPAFALMAAISITGVAQEPIAIAFVASLVILLFFASLTFLLILDKRRTFK